MKTRVVKLLAVIISCAGIWQAPAQENRSLDELRTYIEDARELFGVPGIAVGIIKDGKIMMNEGFGQRNSETGEPVDSLTVFGIASCSKAFTAACMAMLVDDSTVQWNDRVVDHYPEFALSDPCFTKEMQVRDLLCHRSGLQTFDGDLLWYSTDYTREEVVERIRYRDVSYGLRSQFGYQNVMFIAAGELIRKVTGTTWDDFIADRIFRPLDMTNTTTTNSGFSAGMNLAYPHINGKPEPFINYDNSGPAASVNSCSSDLLKWVSTWLNKGTYRQHQLFSRQEYYTLTSPQTLMRSGTAEKVGGTHFNAYGLGWFLFDFEGRKVIQHGGGLPGFHSKVVLVPEDNLGYVILANQLSGLVEAVYKRILDFYLSDTMTDWARLYYENQMRSEARQQEKEQERIASRKTGTSPGFEHSSYTGTYEDQMYGKAVVSENNGILHLELLPTKRLFSSDLEHWEGDTFRITFQDPYLPSGYVTFHGSHDNRVSNFTIDLENPDFHFFKLDFKKID